MCRLSVTARRSVMRTLTPAGRVTNATVLLTFTLAVFTHCVTINRHKQPEIVAKSRVELRPLSISAFLYDVIRISAPVINEEAIYYIHKPNGDVMKLDIHSPTFGKTPNVEDEPLVAKFVNNIKPILTQSNNYDVFSIQRQREDVFEKHVGKMEPNEFLIGPLLVEYHGNWVLSVYTKNIDGEWVEMYQVISVTITEYVPLTPVRPTLKVGETFNLSIAFPIPDLESCELVAPMSTFDRFYDRREISLNTCAFSIPNVTALDSGIWRIVGVGKMVHEGEALLSIIVNNTVA
uniref:Uncharacterized protein n=2 Tax=Heliothis virescens TaxID=7102 RepID=A0A2A4JY47_HELVI